MATVEGLRTPVSPEDQVKALETNHNIQICNILVEVCAPPADFMVTFRTHLNALVCSSVPPSSARACRLGKQSARQNMNKIMNEEIRIKQIDIQQNS